MSKSLSRIIFITITIVVMFGIFRRLFASTDDQSIKEAIINGAFLVDVRTAAEFSEGSVTGAVNIPLSDIPRELDKFKDKKALLFFVGLAIEVSKQSPF